MPSPCSEPAIDAADLCHRKLCVHGLSVELTCAADYFFGHLARMLRPFMVDQLPEGFANRGLILPYAEASVMRQVSSTACRIHNHDPCLEIYQDRERFWLVDERWGLCQINFMRGQWRSWVLPEPSTDPLRVIEGAVLWPMAQLLRRRGLYLVPATAVAKQGWGALLLSPAPLTAELASLIRAGYRVVGQRWTAIRAEGGQIELLHVPGVVEQLAPDLLRRRIRTGPHWVDLTAEHPEIGQYHSFCDAVLVVDAARRHVTRASEVSQPDAERLLCSAWPIVDIHPIRSSMPLWQGLSRRCRCLRLQLSHDSAHLPGLLAEISQSQGHSMARTMVFAGQSGSHALKVPPAA